jgi:hypothetical protein
MESRHDYNICRECNFGNVGALASYKRKIHVNKT